MIDSITSFLACKCGLPSAYRNDFIDSKYIRVPDLTRSLDCRVCATYVCASVRRHLRPKGNLSWLARKPIHGCAVAGDSVLLKDWHSSPTKYDSVINCTSRPSLDNREDDGCRPSFPIRAWLPAHTVTAVLASTKVMAGYSQLKQLSLHRRHIGNVSSMHAMTPVVSAKISIPRSKDYMTPEAYHT